MQYTFACPLDGCEEKMIVDAQNDEEAVAQLSAKAKEHLASTHPDISKTDEQISHDISSMMQKTDPQTSTTS